MFPLQENNTLTFSVSDQSSMQIVNSIGGKLFVNEDTTICSCCQRFT